MGSDSILGDPRFGSQGDPSSVLFKIHPGGERGRAGNRVECLPGMCEVLGSVLGTI